MWQLARFQLTRRIRGSSAIAELLVFLSPIFPRRLTPFSVFHNADEAQRISGKVSGVVNGYRLDDVDLHAYVVTNDGRTYTAISRIPATVGYSLQALYTVGSVLGFLFALPQQPALHNGFMLTGIYSGPTCARASGSAGLRCVLLMLQHLAHGLARSRNWPTATDEKKKSLLYFCRDFSGWYNFGKTTEIIATSCHTGVF